MKRNPRVQKEPLKRKAKETLQEKVHRHIHDKNDVITDEDIRDAIVGGEGTAQVNNRIQEIPEKKHTTPWDISSEGYQEEE